MELKDKKEISIMKEGGKILAHILNDAKSKCKKGVSTGEIDEYIENEILSYKATPSFKNFRGYPFSSCISINEELVHGMPSDRIFKEGDIVGVDIGVLYKGLHTDAAISFGIGKISSKAEKLIKTTKQSLLEGIKIAKPGEKIGSIQAKIQEVIESAGYSVIRDLCGHGIGKKLQEPPCIPNAGIKNSGFVLKEGMTFCLEPMVALGDYKVRTLTDGWTVVTYDKSLTAHFEHTIAITKGGCEILTTID